MSMITVGITGASGFIGRRLVRLLKEQGCACVAFSSRPSVMVAGCKETRIMAPDRPLDLTRLDALVNLAGESILGLWTASKRRRILDSRVRTTRRIVETLAKTPGAPRTLINASAIGYYGNRDEEVLDEDSAPGKGFLTEVSQAWETEAKAAASAGVRVARVRIGFVLGADGGAFVPLKRAFSWGLGGKLGSGQQWMSPVHVDDVAGLIAHLLENAEAGSGAFNAVCPTPVRNEDFTQAVSDVLERPAILPAPAFVLRTVLGDFSHLLLDSARVLPRSTLASGYSFRFPHLAAILADVVKAPL